MPIAPTNDQITIHELIDNPYPFYRHCRVNTPIVRVPATNRTMLTKAVDCRFAKERADLFSNDDPGTPMKRAFEAHTLMRKDGEEHRRERMAMAPTFSRPNLANIWGPMYAKLADQYLDRLPTDEVIDLFPMLAGPLAARILGESMGLPDASDEDLQQWSQALIDGAGNFGGFAEPFERVAKANIAMNQCIEGNVARVRANPDQSALSVMLEADNPIPWSQMVANIKIAIGGAINEPRDALLTVLYGLLSHPEQLEEIKRTGNWMAAFEEAVRWVAPIQVSSRVAKEDLQISGVDIAKGEVVMTCQASANHDEDLFDDGHLYNALREMPAQHQAFGIGPHFCMGTHMARLCLGEILLPKLFARFPNMQLMHAEDVVWKGFGFRGPLNLPVKLA